MFTKFFLAAPSPPPPPAPVSTCERFFVLVILALLFALGVRMVFVRLRDYCLRVWSRVPRWALVVMVVCLAYVFLKFVQVCVNFLVVVFILQLYVYVFRLAKN